MQIRKVLGRVALILALMFLIVATANAQSIVSSTSQTSLNLSIGESLTVSATPASINFNNYSLGAGTATASSPISVVTTGNLAPGHAWVVTWGYLSSPTAALSGPSNIPSSDVFAAIDGGAATACTNASAGSAQYIAGVVSGATCASQVGAAGGNGPIGAQQNPPAGAYSQTDSIVLSLSGASNLLPGTYSGVITFVAGAF
jgi:hypothetical protein